jgi:hypothetical protein
MERNRLQRMRNTSGCTAAGHPPLMSAYLAISGLVELLT